MNTGTTILCTVFIIICAVPFVSSVYGRKKKTKQMFNALTQTLNNHGAKRSQYEVGSDFIIAMDNLKNLVFFTKRDTTGFQNQYVNLRDYKSCEIVKTDNANSIQNLKLQFVPKQASDKAVQFEFYDEEVNNQLDGEYQILNEWHTTIQQKMKMT